MADIRIHLTSVQQLFDSLDPAPFRDKALDRNAEAYLVESAKEFSSRTPLRLVVHGPESLRPSLPDIAAAVRAHFDLALQRLEREMRFRRRIGLRALGFGVLVLASTILVGQALARFGSWTGYLQEGLVIVGSVGLWLPAEALLYLWLETTEERSVLRRLADIPVELDGPGTASPGDSAPRGPR
jgi:hypothetical protein